MLCPNQISSGCGAKFTSTRLRDSHLLMADTLGWSCPLQLAAESLQAVNEVAQAGVAAEAFDTMVLATEIAADAVGQMVLAYGCPQCSRVFIGQNCTARYLAHQAQCVSGTLSDSAAEEQQEFDPSTVVVLSSESMQ